MGWFKTISGGCATENNKWALAVGDGLVQNKGQLLSDLCMNSAWMIGEEGFLNLTFFLCQKKRGCH
jgi:hypothetical protein